MSSIFHLTHKNNFDSLLKHNILSKKLIDEKKIKFEDISIESAQSYREKRKIRCSQGQFFLHNYVPFFFRIRTPMLKYLKMNRPDYKDLFVCKANIGTVFKNKKSYFAFSDGNLASPSSSNYYSWKINKDKIDWDCIYNMHDYPNDDKELKRRLGAEFLVLNMFDITLIDSIIIQSDAEYYRNVMKIYEIDIPIEVKKTYFF